MGNNGGTGTEKRGFSVQVIVGGLCLVWTIIMAGVLWWEIDGLKRSVFEFAAIEARAAFEKDLVYRRWAAVHGGVYVPATEASPPSPYLSHLEEQDVITSGGRKLTLVNPAYMTRQVHEMGKESYGPKGHITSLKPLRPGNAPDDWERTALESFELGVREVRGVGVINGEEYLRLMRPMRTEERCLKCHAEQGYKVGDLRGGISVSVATRPYRAVSEANMGRVTGEFLLVLFLGLAGLGGAGYLLGRREREMTSAMTELRRSEERYRNIVTTTTDGFWIVDSKGRVVDVNDVYCRMSGYSRSELLDMPLGMLEARESETELAAHIQKVMEEGGDLFDTVHRRKDDSLLHVEVSTSYLPDLDFFVAFIKDITERKQAEEQLYESERKFKSLFEEAPLSYQSLDKAGNLLEVNETWLSTLGYERGEVIGRNFGEFIRPGEKSRFEVSFPRFLAVGEILGVEFEVVKKGGETILASFHGRIGKDREGKFRRAHCVLTDITAQKAAEASAGRELSLNRAIAEISSELLSEKYEIKRVADRVLEYALELTDSPHGFASAIDGNTLENVGHTLTDMYGDICRVADRRIAFPICEDGTYDALWGQALNTREAFFTNSPETHPAFKGLPDGHIPLSRFLAVPVVMGDLLMGLIALANSDHDYTNGDLQAMERLAEVYALALYRQRYELEREGLEGQLNHLQKMEAIGTLAGGIAHDFNNILSPIVGYAEMLDEDLQEDSVLRESTGKILTATKRARDLVKQILTFSRQAEQEIKPLRPHLVLKEVLKLIRATIPSTIEVRHEIDPETRPILADPTKIHQVAMNLITNAYHAMAEQGGTLSVTLGNAAMKGAPGEPGTPASAPEVPEGIEGPCVLLSVSDTGVGMEPSVLEKIFNPYFTTKPKDKGTGLGLSVVHGIVKSYGGEIRVASTPAKGTRFHVYLPADVKEELPEEAAGPGAYPTGHERILLVDDEEPVTRLGQKMLQRQGYTVDVMNSSTDALETVKAAPALHDMVITDMTMPNMTGDRLAREILKIRSGMPILICTGFSELITPEKAAAMGIRGYLLKPVLKKELVLLVRKVLDGGDGFEGA